jgi:hypothetical protein
MTGGVVKSGKKWCAGRFKKLARSGRYGDFIKCPQAGFGVVVTPIIGA